MRNARALSLEFALLLAIALLPYAKYAPSILSLRHFPPRLYPPPHPLTPCWSPGARRERLAVYLPRVQSVVALLWHSVVAWLCPGCVPVAALSCSSRGFVVE